MSVELWTVGMSAEFADLSGRLRGVHGDVRWNSEGRSANEGSVVTR